MESARITGRLIMHESIIIWIIFSIIKLLFIERIKNYNENNNNYYYY